MSQLNRVDITVRKADQKTFELLCSHYDDVFESGAFPRAVALVEYRFYRLASEILGFEFLLKANKIPYDKRWECKGQYDAGAEYHRVDHNGQSLVKCFKEHETAPLSQPRYANDGDAPLEHYLSSQQTTYGLISWAEQEVILKQLLAT